jgi:hypothetical protein
MNTTSTDLQETREETGEEPGWAHGCVMGRKDWLNVVCRLEPHLMGRKVGQVGRYAVACDPSMDPTTSRWYYSAARFEEHLSRIQ